MNANTNLSKFLLEQATQHAKEWLDKSIGRVVEVSDCEVGEYSESLTTIWAGEYTLQVTHKTVIDEEPDFELRSCGWGDQEVFVGMDYTADIDITNIDAYDEDNKLVASNVLLDKPLMQKLAGLIAECAEQEAEESANDYDPY